MKKEQEYWKVKAKGKTAQDLDEDLIRELNNKYSKDEEPATKGGLRQKVFKLVGLFTVLAYLALALNQLLAVYTLPSLDFVDRSRELVQDQQMQQLREAVVEISVGNSGGTGFNVEQDGRIITNYHVVDNAGLITVRFPQGPPYAGTVSAVFPQVDLAIIEIEGQGLPVIETDPKTQPGPGDEVTVIGNPLWYSHIVAKGEVAGETTLTGWETPVLRVKAPIHRGSSGSPVIDSSGKAVAVIFATSTQSAGDEIIGLAVPVHHIYE
ncbi:S1C family serine protease [Dethiobacter alkaliphilus]|uniref:S1C family serine protease n=1 Tax=Dethiobacter alkaliphilus TaxID=427926 RepID=UPI002225E1EC|nr:serine protease [Dethiobacter alkaliphilus]MCW3490977.1 serine protease [Dethiobacter alkaliphilus]